MTRVLVVDDEPPILRALPINLRRPRVRGRGGRRRDRAGRVARERPDVVVLDLGLPDMDGVEVIEGVRGWTPGPDHRAVRARPGDPDKVDALDAGADDYVTKPFGMDELLARLRAAVRRAGAGAGRAGGGHRDFTVDLAAKRVTRGGVGRAADPDRVAAAGGARPQRGRLVTQRQLLQEVWGPAYEPRDQLPAGLPGAAAPQARSRTRPGRAT